MHEFFSSESKCTQGAMSRRQRPRKVVVKTELKTTVASLSLSPQERSENGSPSKLDCSENAERAVLHCAHSALRPFVRRGAMSRLRGSQCRFYLQRGPRF